MSIALEKYLDRVMIYANRSEEEAPPIRAELEDHLLKKISDLEDQGLPSEDAVFQAIEDHGHPRTIGYGLRPKFPWLDVRTQGTARGFIAVGQRAVGVFAFGGVSFGVFAFGGLSIGLISFAGVGVGLVLAMGRLAVAPLGFAWGVLAIGLIAFGGLACGIIATGVMAVGLWVPDGTEVIRYFTYQTVPPFLRFFDHYFTYHVYDDVGRNAFTRNVKLVNTVFLFLLAVTFVVRGLLTKKERQRIKKFDPTLTD